MEPGNSVTLVSQIIVTGLEDSFILDKSSSTANQTDFGHSFRSLFGLTCALKEFATDKNPRDAEPAELKMLLTVGMWKPDLIFSCININSMARTYQISGLHWQPQDLENRQMTGKCNLETCSHHHWSPTDPTWNNQSPTSRRSRDYRKIQNSCGCVQWVKLCFFES